MAVTMSGVHTGIDTASIISQLMALEGQKYNRLNSDKTEYATKTKAVGEIQTRLQQLQDLAKTLSDSSTLRRVTLSGGNVDIATASATGNASEGMHTIEVDRLATSERMVQASGLATSTSTVGLTASTALNLNGLADADAAWFTTGAAGATYSLQFGDEPAIEVVLQANASYSLNDVADLVNATSQPANGYDAASIEFDAQSGKNFLKLQASSGETTGVMTQTLTAGEAIAQLEGPANWNKAATGGGAFAYTYDGKTRTINLTAGATLENLRDLINNDADNPGVTASILQHNGQYRLVLSGGETGTEHSITVNSLATTIAGFDSSNFTVTQAASNARFRVDGFPVDGTWMERSTNSVSDVLDGVTLSLAGPGETTIRLTRDTSSLKTDVKNFAAIYNGLADKIAEHTGYDSETKKKGVLQGDSLMSTLLSKVRSAFVGTAKGFAEGRDSFSMPAQIGLTIDKDGHLELDEEVFDDAVENDYAAVLSLMSASANGASDSSYIQFASAGGKTQSGVFEVQATFDGSGKTTAAQVRLSGQIAWTAMTVVNGSLHGVLGTEFDGLALTAVWDGASVTQSAKVYVKQGFAAAVHGQTESILDETDGTFKLQKDQFDSAIEQLSKKMEAEKTRLEKKQEQLKAKFARLEATLTKMEGQQAAFQSMFASLEAQGAS